MERKYRNAYYPNGITMEERLFAEGGRCTQTPIYTWVKILLVGIIIALFSVMITAAAGELGDFSIILFVISGLAILIGAYGIGMFNHGLRCLERAELLYNTRMASIEPEEEDEEEESCAPAPVPAQERPKEADDDLDEIEETYLDACWLEDSERYEEALRYFQSLGDYKDSEFRAAYIASIINKQ